MSVNPVMSPNLHQCVYRVHVEDGLEHLRWQDGPFPALENLERLYKGGREKVRYLLCTDTHGV